MEPIMPTGTEPVLVQSTANPENTDQAEGA
jgi:hypothetical protein